jgi:FKBP-type peptidyl-prolyl cis-trans isomerase (trigger factor)
MKNIEILAKELKKEYSRQWRQRNKMKVNTYYKEWRSQNGEKIKTYQQNYWNKKAIEALEEEYGKNTSPLNL